MKRSTAQETLAIGEIAERTGLAVSAIRFYADNGLITAERTESGHRRFRRSAIRRVSFILICQRLGYSLAEIAEHLSSLPPGKAPTEAQWSRMGAQFAREVNERIAALEQLRDKLNGCIGCGCLSLEACQLWNAEDGAAAFGAGPRYLLGNSSDQLR